MEASLRMRRKKRNAQVAVTETSLASTPARLKEKDGKGKEERGAASGGLARARSFAVHRFRRSSDGKVRERERGKGR